MAEEQPTVAFNLQTDADSEAFNDTLHFVTSAAHKKEIKERADELGFSSMSEAARYFITLGMYSFAQTDPRNNVGDSSTGDHDPLTIREIIPEGRENALNTRDEEVLEEIDKHLAEELSKDPEIEQEGWEVWR